MCGRYTLRTRLEQWLESFFVDSFVEWSPRYNIAPSQSIVAVRNGAGGKREAVLLRWGLVPSWADDVHIGNRLINARAETLGEKPAFKSALKSRRCLIPADGFYEWKQSGKTRQPYLVEMADQRVFAFAGLWDSWNRGQPAIESCTIITTEPNALVASIHDRMPAILEGDAAAAWLDPKTDAATLASLLVACPEQEMSAYPVDAVVNSPSHDSPDCVQPTVPQNRFLPSPVRRERGRG
jgi:putative SOS response-associated peptidase YedK